VNRDGGVPPRASCRHGVLVADNLVEAAGLLLDMVENFVDPDVKAKRLLDAEHEGDRLTHDIYSRLNATFITPFDREDIHALAGQLDDVLDAMEAAADMLVLHQVTAPLDAVVGRSTSQTASTTRPTRSPPWYRHGCSSRGRPSSGRRRSTSSRSWSSTRRSPTLSARP
jgi:uncharacterized protein Yka (UPF0111/DUF47 family)